jgi:hypothetical protein
MAFDSVVLMGYRRLVESSQSCSSKQTVPLELSDINKETAAEQTRRKEKRQDMTAKSSTKKKKGKTNQQPT